MPESKADVCPVSKVACTKFLPNRKFDCSIYIFEPMCGWGLLCRDNLMARHEQDNCESGFHVTLSVGAGGQPFRIFPLTDPRLWIIPFQYVNTEESVFAFTGARPFVVFKGSGFRANPAHDQTFGPHLRPAASPFHYLQLLSQIAVPGFRARKRFSSAKFLAKCGTVSSFPWWATW